MGRRVWTLGILGTLAAIGVVTATRPWSRSPGGAARSRAVVRQGESQRTVSLEYTFNLPDVPDNARQVLAWVPLPLEDEHQALLEVSRSYECSWREIWEPEYRNRFLLLDLTERVRRAGGEVAVSVEFRVRRSAYRVLDRNDSAAIDAAALARYLEPDSLVPIGGRIAEAAHLTAQDAPDPLAKARRLYDDLTTTMTYDKTVPGWGRGDATRACDVRRGNCSDFHSLFIAEARALGTPARFVMGLPLPEGKTAGEIGGYHCWAEFYVAGKGWVPLDVSEASKQPEKREDFFGGLDANRIAFTIGRDIRLPEAAAGPLNFVIGPHVEVDGQVLEEVEVKFSFREVLS